MDMQTAHSTAAGAPSSDALAPACNGLSLDERFALLRSVGEECISEEDLKRLLEKKPNIRCYDGFEPSGRMHIAQGIFKSVNVNKCTAAGAKFVFWVADWFALMNDKMGGHLDNIRLVGEYLLEVWKAAGMDLANVIFLWSSDEINKHAAVYWKRVMDIGRCNSLARIKKCCQIMGRAEGNLSSAQILYPLMQCADIFFLQADICQLGLDQRKVNMLAREYCDSIKQKNKPIILSHHMLAGLKAGQAKMSKSDPDSAIFMEDSAVDVARKIAAAHCPRVAQAAAPMAVSEDDSGAPVASDDKNPCMDYIRHIIFSNPQATFTPSDKDVVYRTYEAVEAAFLAGEISEEGLKGGLTTAINALLEPVRQHFATNPRAGEVLKKVRELRGAAAPTAAAHEAPTKVRGAAWLPVSLRLELDTALSLVHQLNGFAGANGEGAEAVLIVPDWSAFATGELGEEKVVTAAQEYHLRLLQAYGLGPHVRVVKQSDAVLNDPNDFWLTVIAAGRKLPLSDIEAAYGHKMDNAGQVIASLMRIADIATQQITHVITAGPEKPFHDLAAKFFAADSRAPFHVVPRATTITALGDPKLPVSVTETLMADDSEQDLRSKVKKGYAAPGDSDNGLLRLAAAFIQLHSKFDVTRPEENGGSKSFLDFATLSADSASSALHPGDLKAAVSAPLMELTKVARELAKKPEVKNWCTVISNAEKKSKK